jgi:hypothetical protein
MKLYRGTKAKEFSHFTPDVAAELRNTWDSILTERARGDFGYPDEFNDEILEASRLVRLQRQYFTDDKNIASSYAKENDGTLIEIDLSVADILDHFTIEFQNFAQRKKNFEIVYMVDSSKLYSHAKKWKLKTSSL